MERLVQLFRALSDETRLRIVMLLTRGELCVCDVMMVLGQPQSKVSRHLAYLKHSRLTQSRRVGVWMHYWLDESSSGIHRPLIHFLRGELSHLQPFCTDMEKLLEMKRQGGCKAAIKFKTFRRRKTSLKKS